jgi:hypothetical protein
MRSADTPLAVPRQALAEATAPAGRGAAPLVITIVAASGFALTLAVFWPGVMTFDARFVLEAARAGTYGDWQSPVLAALWRVIDQWWPGPAGLLVLTATLYWTGFALVGAVLTRRSRVLGFVAVLLGFTPPAFMFLGILWRDVLFGCVWLLAAALAFVSTAPLRNILEPYAPSRAAVLRPAGIVRLALRLAAVALVILGVLLRPNALLAAPLLIAYAVSPSRLSLRRMALFYVPAGLALFGLLQLVYYGVLGATREHPLHSLAVFDLGGITHFSGDVRLPGAWTADERHRLLTDCYDPYLWDAYWYGRPCAFVMERLERRERVFGTAVITTAWRDAVLTHPLAWLSHRAAFSRTFLIGPTFTLWVADLDDKSRLALPDNRAFAAMVAVHDVLKPTLLFRAGVWLVACVLLAAAALRRRDTPAGAFVVAVAGSAAVYVASFTLLGVAADLRYAWWSIVAVLACLPAWVATARR